MNNQVLSLAFLAAFSFTANPPDETGDNLTNSSKRLPSAEDLIENHLKAIGGRKRLDQMTSRRETMRTTYPHAPDAWTITIEETNQKDQRLTRYTRADGKTESTGYDGKTPWAIRDDNPEILKGDDAARQIFFSKIYDFKSGIHEFASAIVKGPVTFHNYRCYWLDVEFPSGLTLDFYFQIDTGLCVGVSYQLTYDGDVIKVERTLQSYQAIKGIRIARKSITHYHNQNTNIRWKTVTRTQSIELDVDFPKGHFNTPPSVKASLLKKTKRNETEKSATKE